MIDWIGKNNREINAIPLLHFREALKHLKILRTFKGQLLPTRRARPAVDDPDTLWSLLAESLIPAPGSFAARRHGAAARPHRLHPERGRRGSARDTGCS